MFLFCISMISLGPKSLFEGLFTFKKAIFLSTPLKRLLGRLGTLKADLTSSVGKLLLLQMTV